jgi:hypothetical protein
VAWLPASFLPCCVGWCGNMSCAQLLLSLIPVGCCYEALVAPCCGACLSILHVCPSDRMHPVVGCLAQLQQLSGGRVHRANQAECGYLCCDTLQLPCLCCPGVMAGVATGFVPQLLLLLVLFGCCGEAPVSPCCAPLACLSCMSAIRLCSPVVSVEVCFLPWCTDSSDICSVTRLGPSVCLAN